MQTKHNSKLEIKEIIVINEQPGEYNQSIGVGKDPSDSKRVGRINHYIERLMDKALNIHKNDINSNQSEVIVRITTNEFSFYTKERPLSIKEYQDIIDHLFEYGKTLPPNIHMVLATFPVLWPNGIVHNSLLYFQSPLPLSNSPKIHHMNKINADILDLTYDYYDNASKEMMSYDLARENPKLDEQCELGHCYHFSKVLKNSRIELNDINQYKNALKIHTVCDSLLVMVDICLDHKHGMGATHLSKLITQLGEKNIFIPNKVSHLLTSHTISKKQKHIRSSLTHADRDHFSVGIWSKEKVDELTKSSSVSVSKMEGFGNKVRLLSFPLKKIGTLYGEDFDNAYRYNHQYYSDVTLTTNGGDNVLFYTISSTTSPLELILERVETYKKYFMWKENDQCYQIKKFVSDKLMEGIEKDNMSDIYHFTKIAHALDMFLKENSFFYHSLFNCFLLKVKKGDEVDASLEKLQKGLFPMHFPLFDHIKQFSAMNKALKVETGVLSKGIFKHPKITLENNVSSVPFKKRKSSRPPINFQAQFNGGT